MNRLLGNLIHSADLLTPGEEVDFPNALTDASVLARARTRELQHQGQWGLPGQRSGESLVDFIRRYKRERKAKG